MIVSLVKLLGRDGAGGLLAYLFFGFNVLGLGIAFALLRRTW